MKKIGISILSALSLACMIGIMVVGINTSNTSASEDTAQMTNGTPGDSKEKSANQSNQKSEDENSLNQSRTYKPSKGEISNLSIPKQISSNANESLSTASKEPEYIVTETDQVKDIRAWHPTNENDILVAEAIYKNGIDIPELTHEVKSWFTENQTVEEITVEGQIAILHTDSNVCELHVITTDKLYTVAGADRETVLDIAAQIDLDN